MASCKFPCFSLEAAGRLATNFYFQRRRGGNTAFCLYRPDEVKQTVLQHFYRRLFGMIIELWRIELPAVVAAYNRRAVGLSMSGFNIYYREIYELILRPRSAAALSGISRCGGVP